MENTELYDVLGVDKNATDADIEKNYRELVKESPPEKLQEISFAYEVLSNPEKRQTYDTHGLKGLQESGEAGCGTADFFTQWFPFRNAQNRETNPTKPHPMTVKLPVSLAEFYNGNVSKTVNYTRMECCETCHGKGGPDEAVVECVDCEGLGRTANTLMGFSTIQMMCQTCMGRGHTVKEELRCSECTGRGLVAHEHTQEVTVERGAPNLMKYPFPAEGHQSLSGERGDLIVVLVQEEHETFVRDKNDLYMRQLVINLAQALCGFEHCFKHLDERLIYMHNKPGEVLRPREMRIVPGEGMPLHNNPFEKGDLYVELRVEFPEDNFATPDQLKTLESVLPPREPIEIPPEAEEVDLHDPHTSEETFEGAHGGEEDLGAGMQFDGVQCHTS